jgi:hypothetical protein
MCVGRLAPREEGTYSAACSPLIVRSRIMNASPNDCQEDSTHTHE